MFKRGQRVFTEVDGDTYIGTFVEYVERTSEPRKDKPGCYDFTDCFVDYDFEGGDYCATDSKDLKMVS